MFDSLKSILAFIAGLGLTIGLLLTPRLIPGGWGFAIGLRWSAFQIILVVLGGLVILALTLWIAGKMVRHAQSWKEPKAIMAAVLIALVANTLYMFLIDWFSLHSGWRALIAVLGVPIIYGNLARVLAKTTLAKAMESIFVGALTTMGAGFIIAVIIHGW